MSAFHVVHPSIFDKPLFRGFVVWELTGACNIESFRVFALIPLKYRGLNYATVDYIESVNLHRNVSESI